MSQTIEYGEYAARLPSSHAALPAMMQILAVEKPDLRIALVDRLQSRPADDATIAALVRLAIFDPDAGVRTAAVDALGRLPFSRYGAKLLDGLRHPWPRRGRARRGSP